MLQKFENKGFILKMRQMFFVSFTCTPEECHKATITAQGIIKFLWS